MMGVGDQAFSISLEKEKSLFDLIPLTWLEL